MLKMQGTDIRIKVAFCVTNCICNDRRVLKIAESVRDLGTDVSIIGRKKGKCCDNDQVHFTTRRFRMLFRKGFLFYMFFNMRLFLFLLFHRYDLLVANDLDTLLPVFLVSKIRKLPVVYDSHEYFTGVKEIQDRPFVKYIWKLIERNIFPRLKHIMTVSEMIADRYLEEYCIKPLTIMNCSGSSVDAGKISREEAGIHKDQLVLILQGTGINADRGGEELVKAACMTDNVLLFVIGSGSAVSSMKMIAGDNKEKIRFCDVMPWNNMMKYTRAADIGFSLDLDTNENHLFSLPNKLFDYISAGIAVITSNVPQVAGIVKENDMGIVLDEVTPLKIAEAIAGLEHDRERLSVMKRNSALAANKYNWENESKKVKAFYSGIISGIKRK